MKNALVLATHFSESTKPEFQSFKPIYHGFVITLTMPNPSKGLRLRYVSSRKQTQQ
jgi:hypothetical protein